MAKKSENNSKIRNQSKLKKIKTHHIVETSEENNMYFIKVHGYVDEKGMDSIMRREEK